MSSRIVCIIAACTLISLHSSRVAAQDAAAKSAAAPTAQADAAAADPASGDIEKAYAGAQPPESVRMLLAITRGSNMGPGDGWFGPADARYNWKWLADKHGVAIGDAIPKEKFQGSERGFDRLDRNKDGRITADDLDWSDKNSWVQQANIVNRLFRKIDAQRDSNVTREEWLEFFNTATAGGEALRAERLRDLLLAGGSGFSPGDAPSKETLIRGLFSGEIGSLNEGPKLNARAPDFALLTHDGSRTIRLADVVGSQPVVLTFGNSTCGPFRSMYPGVEDIHKRFKDEATFLTVYVREAHPTDGWKMQSNRLAGIDVGQPKTFAERCEVATQCHKLLQPSMPLLVDEINDPIGNAYSGMPARLYVIDREGRVAYKSGRGPFGFKTGEMEQSLIMTLLDQSPSPTAAVAPAAVPAKAAP